MAKLLILAASTGKNLELAMDLQSAAEVHGHDVDVMDLCALDLPIYTPESENSIRTSRQSIPPWSGFYRATE